MYLLIFEVILFFRVDSIPMLYDDAETILIFFLLHNQTLHIFYFKGNFAFLLAKHQDGGLNELEIFFVLFALVDFDTGALGEGCDCGVFGLGIILQHPDVGMETLEVNVEYLLVVLHYG